MEKSSKEIKEAKQVLEEISQDETERYLAELREKYIRDHKSAENTGIKKGEKNILFIKYILFYFFWLTYFN